MAEWGQPLEGVTVSLNQEFQQAKTPKKFDYDQASGQNFQGLSPCFVYQFELNNSDQDQDFQIDSGSMDFNERSNNTQERI